MKKDKDTCNCRIGDAKDVAALLAQLNSWDKNELENYYANTYLCANCEVDYISSGETAGFVEAHLKCLQSLGVSVIWDSDKKAFRETGNIFIEQSDLKIWNEKGNIKTKTLFLFAPGANPDNVSINSDWQQKIVVHYNRDGNVDSIAYIDGKAKATTATTIYAYTGDEKLGKENNSPFYTYRKKWLATNTFVETMYDSSGAVESMTTVVIEMQDNRKVITEKKWIKVPEELFNINIEGRYFFDEQGRFISRKEKISDTPETEETNSDLQFDAAGNATKSVKSGGKIILRQYEYYY
ncbi:hypothetical protein [Polluticoccus soli]